MTISASILETISSLIIYSNYLIVYNLTSVILRMSEIPTAFNCAFVSITAISHMNVRFCFVNLQLNTNQLYQLITISHITFIISRILSIKKHIL